MPFKATHGMTETKIWRTWRHMIARCTKKTHAAYKNYGGRGITVCERWLKFENFYEDMGDAPKRKSLDRIDNNKGYFKENCRWATPSEQQRNRRTTLILMINGDPHTPIQIAEKLGVEYGTLWKWALKFNDRNIDKLLKVVEAARNVLPFYEERVLRSIETIHGFNPYESTLHALSKALDDLEKE